MFDVHSISGSERRMIVIAKGAISNPWMRGETWFNPEDVSDSLFISYSVNYLFLKSQQVC